MVCWLGLQVLLYAMWRLKREVAGVAFGAGRAAFRYLFSSKSS